MKILLTGSTGFLGSHLLERLVDLNHSVICLKRESSNLKRVENKKVKTEIKKKIINSKSINKWSAGVTSWWNFCCTFTKNNRYN